MTTAGNPTRGPAPAPSAYCGPMSALTARELLLVDAIADRVAERLRPAAASPRPAELVDARTVAQALGVSDKSVYRHAAALGAVRVGRRLRFDLVRALASWPAGEDDRFPSGGSQPPRSPAKKPTSSGRRESSDAAHCRLLPVGRRTGPE